MRPRVRRSLNLATAACAISVFLATTAIDSPAQTFRTLAQFDVTDGAQPVYVSLAQGTDGNLYGTTVGGGTNRGGTVFKISPWGRLTTLYNFCAQSNCTDGAQVYAGLVRAPNGDFYGTTYSGGEFGNGTVFRITPLGILTTLHSFNYSAGEGAGPFAALVRSASGDFYGSTTGGGPFNAGTIFKVTSSGVFTTLHTFDGSDGSLPVASLIEGNDGNFYGTAGQFVIQMTPAGALTTLHTFTGTDGLNPNGLIRGTDGSFYGTTFSGGDSTIGTIFKITPGGTLMTLYNFDSIHGANPIATLAEGTDSNFYGTTYAGGTGGDWGTVFKITPAGVLTSLHSFDGTDGGQPYGPVTQSINGTFYGTTTNAGSSNSGTLFSLSTGLSPFIETTPTSGSVGTTVVILGSGLGYNATGVAFNGTTASFEAFSANELRAVVPVGATAGRVTVTTINGTLTSNMIFRVIP